MGIPNSTKTRTWGLLTAANGEWIDDEYDQLYENDNYLSQRTQEGYFANALIDPRFMVWNAGTGAFTSDGYTATMWKAISAGSKTHSVSRAAFTLGQTDVPNNPKYYLQNVIAGSGSGTGYYSRLWQPIFGVDKFAGQKASISFYAKASAGTPKVAVDFTQNFGTTGSPSSDVNTLGDDVTLSTSWQKFTIENISIPSVSGKTLGSDNNDYLAVNFWLAAGGDYDSRLGVALGDQSFTLSIADVVFNYGEFAIDIQPKTEDEYQQDCLPFYESSYENGIAPGTSTANGSIRTVAVNSVDLYFETVHLWPKARAVSNIAIYSTTGASGTFRDLAASADVGTQAIAGITRKAFIVNNSAANFTPGNSIGFQYVDDRRI